MEDSPNTHETRRPEARRSKGWYSRGYLPHYDRPGLIPGITFRLYDSLPSNLLKRWEEELRSLPAETLNAERRRRISEALDAGHGACWLRGPGLAEIVQQTLFHYDGQHYRLFAWVVMPNHVHVLAEMAAPLADVVRVWKTWSARQCNMVLQRTGAFWHREYFDRYIRDGEHFEDCKRYIEHNPVKAGLCKTPQGWAWGSAHFEAQEGKGSA